jgi:hypothetical protein
MLINFGSKRLEFHRFTNKKVQPEHYSTSYKIPIISLIRVQTNEKDITILIRTQNT